MINKKQLVDLVLHHRFLQVKSEPAASKTFDYYPYFAYAPNGTVEGELVYINQGYPSDIKFLLSRNISLQDKVVIARGLGASVIIIILLLQSDTL